MPLVIPDMVEGAIDAIVAQVQSELTPALTLVDELWVARGAPPLNLPSVAPNQVYIAEAIEPLVLPAVFVVADRSEHDLSAQQWLKQAHGVLVAIVVESTVGAEHLQRMIWRYGQAMWLALHDQHLGSPRATHVLVRELSYGPTALFAPRGGQRTYRKDITLRVTATQREAFEH